MIQRIKQFVLDPALRRYVAVGIFNTLLSFALYSLGVAVIRLDPLVSNVISTIITLCVSYFLNRKFVFRSNAGYVQSAVTFVAVTLFSGLLVQSGVIWLVLRLGGLWFPAASAILVKEIAKVVAIGVGMFANYIGYHWLFRVAPSISRRRVLSADPAQEQERPAERQEADAVLQPGVQSQGKAIK